MKILIIGGGNMGLTFAQSFLRAHIVTPDQLFILEKSMAKAKALKNKNIGTVHGDLGPFVSEADLIILAVKPQDTSILFKKLKTYIKDQLILSIMAGVKVESITQHLGATKVIRAMPNLPAQIGNGMTVFTSSDDVSRIELVTVQNLLNSTGKTIYVEKEKMIDAATAISGSGPAYVFYFMQALIQAAKSMDFTHAESELLAFQTFKGAINLFNNFDFSCEEWIEKVSSKGGTTEAAFHSMHKHEVAQHFQAAVKQALLRAEELGA